MDKRDREKPKRDKEGERQPEEREHDRDYDKDDRHREHARGRGYGFERSGYLEFLARKWHGSEPPTPQAYARAIKQWRRLPGAVIAAPADLGAVPPVPPARTETGKSES
ncbi:MAG TPA: hypothetical protein VNY05_40495 [Candidatus Acidoferrales bacterium]|nr:hypothetical protein [Candidatus Acidoferrales bacterium]